MLNGRIALVGGRLSPPPCDGCGEADGGHEVDGELVVASGDPPSVFRAAEHPLDRRPRYAAISQTALRSTGLAQD